MQDLTNNTHKQIAIDESRPEVHEPLESFYIRNKVSLRQHSLPFTDDEKNKIAQNAELILSESCRVMNN